jgi:hypothetical protein
MKHVLIALMLFAALPCAAQNVVLNDSLNYAAFRLNGDTLDTSHISAFFDFMGIGNSEEQDAAKAATLAFLKNMPTSVDVLNEVMQITLNVSLEDYACFFRLQERQASHVSLEDYACFFRLQERRVRIITTRN